MSRMDGTTDGGAERRARRWTALLLSIVAPGLGHLAIGYPRRLVAWYGSLLAILAAVVVLGRFGVSMIAPVAIALAVLLQLGAALDTFRLPRPAVLPRPRTVLLIAVGLLAFYRVGVRGAVEAFQIPSGSMYPTLSVGDHIFVSKVAQRYTAGDLVVFRYPKDPRTDYIKRIVAVGGDTIEGRADGTLVVNGQPIARTETSLPCSLGEYAMACSLWEEQLGGRRYLISHDKLSLLPEFNRTVVPPGHVFVIGDNRENSSDSRVWGTVKNELLVGKVVGIWWSRGPEGIRWNRMFGLLE
jgi:signal peptidase I